MCFLVVFAYLIMIGVNQSIVVNNTLFQTCLVLEASGIPCYPYKIVKRHQVEKLQQENDIDQAQRT